MKLKEFADNLVKIVKKNPELLECEVLYADNEHGDVFKKIEALPTLGVVKDIHKNDYFPRDIDINVSGANVIIIN